MNIKLYTSDEGLKNRFEGKRMIVFTTRDDANHVEITVNFDEIQEMHNKGLLVIKPK